MQQSIDCIIDAYDHNNTYYSKKIKIFTNKNYINENYFDYNMRNSENSVANIYINHIDKNTKKYILELQQFINDYSEDGYVVYKIFLHLVSFTKF